MYYDIRVHIFLGNCAPGSPGLLNTLPLPQTHGGGYQDRKGQEHVDKIKLMPILGGGVSAILFKTRRKSSKRV